VPLFLLDCGPVGVGFDCKNLGYKHIFGSFDAHRSNLKRRPWGTKDGSTPWGTKDGSTGHRGALPLLPCCEGAAGGDAIGDDAEDAATAADDVAAGAAVCNSGTAVAAAERSLSAAAAPSFSLEALLSSSSLFNSAKCSARAATARERCASASCILSCSLQMSSRTQREKMSSTASPAAAAAAAFSRATLAVALIVK
jgi:hypothetical protein